MQKNLKRGLAHGATEATSKTWPGLPELSLLRVIGLIWPTSDMKHHVVSPARLLMGSYLGLCRVRSLQDLTSGLFLCSLFLHYEGLSKRLVPEAINFLLSSVSQLAPTRFQDNSSLPGCFPAPDFRSNRCSFLAIGPANVSKGLKLEKPNLTELLCKPQETEQSRVNLFGLTLDMLGQFADLYKGLDGFVELYGPAVELLDGIEADDLPSGVSVGNVMPTASSCWLTIARRRK